MGWVEVLLLLLKLSSMGSTKAEIASTKAPFDLPSNCMKRCGTIDIEYPFGIGTGCYREGFNLTCTDNTTKPLRLFLGDGKLMITRIDLDNGTVRVKTPRTIDTCITRCTSNDNSHCILSLYDWNSTSLEVRLTRLNQSDLYLLDASIIKVFVYDYYNSTTDDLQRTVKGNSSEVETALSWYIKDYPTCEEAKKNMKTYACISPNSDCYDVVNYAYTNYNFGYICRCSLNHKGNPYLANGCTARQNGTTFACVDKNSLCVNITKISNEDIWGYRCNCPEGYQGNPYIANGCKGTPKAKILSLLHIDECSIPNKNVCNGICRNTIGGYECLPDKKQTVLVGVVIGVSLGSGLLLLSISFIILRKKWKQRKQKKIRERHFHQNHGLLLQQLISSNEDVAERTKIFSLEEIEKATNNFDETRVLGRGGHGTVYKGILSDQRVVAIKKSKIVKKKTEVPLLVYEFISNGTLADHLHVSDASISILHRDVKSSNILLDDHFMAKVSDFGASRFIPLDETHIITVIQGTFGYLDPEYYQTSQLTEKSDVYSFGVILLELLTGKKPVFSIEHENRQNLSMHFLQAMKEKHSFDLVEDRVMKEGTKQELLEIIQLIEMCLKLNGIERPTMKEVEHKLQNLRRIGKKKGCPITEGMEETEYLLSDSSYTFSDSIDQTTEGTSRNYSLEKEFLWSLYNPR
ncbi:OsWAK receptor-like protein kinase [Musa troglodytarum]|uniref:OsWAK receptor-like protein kinase n=1 Tax=Musa troglodytarum TaxID=320322 RepID=A0A9E7F7E1_9LILI|nr:OsWAK receptor-like protein kinase [Musa troglodytarum]